ncbi:MAG: AAA family ATPase [Candidatus Schekmanbacteria bacterium]|nr:AAA family ATPase [Candidatus Schekmanbacteria bacterium]
MKIAVTGKGGVGKTTLTALLGGLWAENTELPVTVVDADPSMNLAMALGIPEPIREKIVPLADMKELIEERTGSKQWGFFKLNPKVDDIAAKLEVLHNGLRLIVMGTIVKGGSGCACQENVLLRAFLAHLLLEPDEVVIVDMEAGLEHLGRRTIQSVDALIVVIEPGQRSLDVGRRIKKLAGDIGLNKIFFVGNKIHHPAEHKFLQENLDPGELLAIIPDNPAIAAADLTGDSVIANLDPKVRNVLVQLKLSLERGISGK